MVYALTSSNARLRWFAPLMAAAVGCGGASATSDAAPCRTDRQCPGQLCDRATGTCVDCLTHADCDPGEQVCDVGICIEVTFCSSSRECTDQVCDPSAGYCVDCLLDADCLGLNEYCIDRTCLARDPCSSSRDCTYQVCDPGQGFCVDCLSDDDCLGEGEWCDFAGNVCRAGSGSDADADVDVYPGASDDVSERADVDTLPDGDGGSCPETPCRLWPPCGCPAGQKCTVVSGSDPASNTCIPAGTGTTTMTCEHDQNCMSGTGCVALWRDGVESADMAMCSQYCNTHADCSGTGSACVPWTSGATTPGTCSHPCDIVSNVGCPAGTKCQMFSLDDATILTECTDALGTGSVGSYCDRESQCAGGSFCGYPVDAYYCIAYCTNPPYGSCPAGTCNPFGPRVFIGGTEFGYCW